MKRRAIIILLITFAIMPAIISSSDAAVYEASTLHNAVARSETVLDLFFERWERIQNMELYFDWYGRLNWVQGFNINAVNQGTKQKESVDMRLVRAYGSITVNIPVIGGYSGEDMRKRLQYGTGKYAQIEEASQIGNAPQIEEANGIVRDKGAPGGGKKADEGGWIKPKNLILGFTATGFHYGLTREGTINRGTAGEETFTDYKYTQFFDDIFAVSLLYRPYFHIHAGMVLSQQFEPRDDGTMSYSDPVERSKRYFVASNLLSFLNLNATTRKDEMESLAVGLIINEMIAYVNKNLGRSFPQLTVTYKQLNLFNDRLYDPVWVESYYISSTGTPKSSTMPDSERDEAKLYTLSAGLKGFLGNWFYMDLYAEAQKPSADLVSRLTQSTINYAVWRDLRALVGYNFLGSSINTGNMIVASVGMSKYWDPAIPIHRNSGTDYHVYGGIFQLEGRIFAGGVPLGMDFRVSKNYSPELRRMVETVDKWVYEGSFNMSF
jgi:hypothetical protein